MFPPILAVLHGDQVEALGFRLEALRDLSFWA